MLSIKPEKNRETSKILREMHREIFRGEIYATLVTLF